MDLQLVYMIYLMFPKIKLSKIVEMLRGMDLLFFFYIIYHSRQIVRENIDSIWKNISIKFTNFSKLEIITEKIIKVLQVLKNL